MRFYSDPSLKKDGDVLISIAGTIGRIAVMTKDFLPANTNQAVALIRPFAKILPSGLINRFHSIEVKFLKQNA